MTCIPAAVWWNDRPMVANNSTTLCGRAIQATVSACDAPASNAADTANQSVSGSSSAEVTRWCHQCIVPDFAEPRPRTRPSGERSVVWLAYSLAMVRALLRPNDQGEDPGQH